MKNKCLLLFMLLFSQSLFCQNIGALISYCKEASSFAKQTKNQRTAKNIKQIRIINSDTIFNNYTILCSYNKKEPYFCIIDSAYLKIRYYQKDKYISVNNTTNEYSIEKVNKKSALNNSRFHAENIVLALNYYQSPIPKLVPIKPQFITNKIDTIIRNTHYNIFVTDETRDCLDKQGNVEKTVKIEQNIFINQTTKDIDSIIMKSNYSDGNQIILKEYVESNESFNYEDFQKQIDFNNPKYHSYSKHDENTPPSSTIVSDNKSLNSKILSFPILKLNGKKTTIAEENGWILLDFWQFGCRPCFEQFKRFAAENDSLGQTILEKNNITILSIHPFSDNMEMIAQIGEKYHVSQYLYSAKGLNTEIEIISYPTYYLISPDKKIVHKTNHLGDYSEILQIIKQYNNK